MMDQSALIASLRTVAEHVQQLNYVGTNAERTHRWCLEEIDRLTADQRRNARIDRELHGYAAQVLGEVTDKGHQRAEMAP